MLRRPESSWYSHYDESRDEAYGRQEESLAESFYVTEGRQRYWNQIREIQDELGISHQEARARWSDYYHHGGRPKRAVKCVALSVKASIAAPAVCPFCRDSIFHPDEGGPDFVCPNCRAHYHLDCFEEELGSRCATLGCSTRRVMDQARTRIRARARQRLQERPGAIEAAEAARQENDAQERPQPLWLRILEALFDLAEGSPILATTAVILLISLLAALFMAIG